MVQDYRTTRRWEVRTEGIRHGSYRRVLNNGLLLLGIVPMTPGVEGNQVNHVLGRGKSPTLREG